MKKHKFLGVTVLIGLAVVAFFLPYKSYYSSLFIFTSDHKTYERVWDVFMKCSIGGKIDLLVVFSPAIALVTLRTWLARNTICLLIVSILSSWMLLGVAFGLNFELFEAYTKYLAGYFLFMVLSILGCMAFWVIIFYQTWHRICDWRQKFKVA